MHTSPLTRIFPSSALRNTEVDEAFQQEYEQAKDEGQQPALYDSFNDKVITFGGDISNELLLYRGWILSPGDYRKMEIAVENKGASLLVTTENYRNAQFMDGYYPALKGFMAHTEFVDYDASLDEIQEALLNITQTVRATSFVVKGTSKSLKHDWDNSMFIKDALDAERVVNNFRSQVSKNEEPKLVLRGFENYQNFELRVWFLGSRLLGVTNHSQSGKMFTADEIGAMMDGAGLPNFIKLIELSLDELNGEFVTVDLTCTESGGWRVVEAGSGGVSESTVDLSKLL